MVMSEGADPIINDLNRPFWDGAAKGCLMLPYCVATGAAFWPPSSLSPFAAGREVEWREVAAAGTVVACVTYRRPFQKKFAPLLPYGIAMVELDSGPRLQAHVEQPDEAGSPRTGDRVTLAFKALLERDQNLLVARRVNV
jgi:uncharacterized OB-fold protein